MKKVAISVVVCALAMLAVTPSHAAVDVTATILTPTPFAGTGENAEVGDLDCTDMTDPTCEKGPVAKLARCLYVESGGASQTEDVGVQGFVIPLDGQTTFRLAAEPEGSADFDVTFYLDLTICESIGKTSGDGFAHFGTGEESGAIPPDTAYAIVTLYGSAAQTFTFTAS